MLTAKQQVDLITSHWQELFPLSSRERSERLDQLMAEAEYQETLCCVAKEMSCVSTSSITSEVSSLSSSALS